MNPQKKLSLWHLNRIIQIEKIIMKELSYQLGILVGNNLASQVNPDDLDLLALARGIEDILGGRVSAEDMEKAGRKVQAYMQDVVNAKAANAQADGQAFLEENAKREEVIIRPSGLQYEVLKAGTGQTPAATNTVVAHYEGRLLDGTVFDSSIMRGEPAQFPVNNLIQGWQEALQLMPVGSKWRLYIPSNLAYGSQGAGRDIPPFATLIFDLELIDIVK
jgi:FKBP-type peptidyl-prolyl cis-trans isomerase FklB